MEPDASRPLGDPGPLDGLTARERDLLAAVGAGLTDAEVGARLGVTDELVGAELADLLAKLGLRSRLQAVVFALRHGLVEIG